MDLFEKDQIINDILIEYPNFLTLLKENDINLIEFGHKTIENAIIEKDLNEMAFLEKLNSSHKEFIDENEHIDLKKIDLKELSEFIVDIHHEKLYLAMPRISNLIKTITKSYGKSNPDLEELSNQYYGLSVKLDEHLIKEETIFFPEIEKYYDYKNDLALGKARDGVYGLINDHELMLEKLKSIRSITNNYTLPESYCDTFELTYSLLMELEYDVVLHFLLEEQILFPRLLNFEF